MSFPDSGQADSGLTDFFQASNMAPLFWRPRFVAPSSHWHHVPLLFWLVNVIRPTRALVFGVGDGALFFAICQALDKLQLPGRCIGLLTEHPEHPSSHQAHIIDHANQFYEDIATLKNVQSEDTAPGSLELLIVDPANWPNRDASTAGNLRSTLTPHGVMVILGADHLQHERERAFFRQIATEDASRIVVEVGPGLSLVFGDDGPPDGLKTLLPIQTGGFLPNPINTVLRRIGRGLADTVQVTLDQVLVQNLQKMLDESEKQRRELANAFEDLEQQYEARNEAACNSQAALFDLQREREFLQNELEKSRSVLNATSPDQVQILKEQLASKEEQFKIAERTHADEKLRLEKELTASRGDLRIRFQELATLTRELEKQRAELVLSKSTLKKKEHDLEIQKRRVDKIKASLSWRLTSPIRAIGKKPR